VAIYLRLMKIGLGSDIADRISSVIADFSGPSIPPIKPGWTRLIYCKSVELMLF
jgi:hypothetical protein